MSKEDDGMMAIGIEHVGLKAGDPEKLAQWYREIFNFKVVSRNDKTPPTLFVGGKDGCLIEIMPKPADRELLSPFQKREAHLAIKVDDFAAMIDKLRINGLNVGKVEYKTGVTNMIFFADPEGNWIQVVYRPVPLK
jgi:catechol 2,3-dioxygenase-like lactoylglutathione lyase family enzyme